MNNFVTYRFHSRDLFLNTAQTAVEIFIPDMSCVDYEMRQILHFEMGLSQVSHSLWNEALLLTTALCWNVGA